MAARAGERPTPYGLVFAHEPFEADYFPAIAAEAEARHGDTRSFESFVGLEEVTELLGRLLPDSESGGAESAAALARHAKLLYHAFHYWRDGGRVYATAPELARRLLAPGAVRAPASTLVLPAPSGYVQLPPNLLWSRVEEDVPPEPVDGFFWTRGIDGYSGVDRIELVFALGVRAGRPGFSLIDVGAALGEGAPEAWERQPGRDGAADFTNILPGGELDALHSLTTDVEALKLTGRWFAYVAAEPGALDAADGCVNVRLVNG
jgi:hypothetical protein